MLRLSSSRDLSHPSLFARVSGSVQWNTAGSERRAKTAWLSEGERGRRRRRSVIMMSLGRDSAAGEDMVGDRLGANGKVVRS